jgi:hypothetical protein
MNLRKMQDIIMQDWVMEYEPDVDEDGYQDGDIFTGIIAATSTGDVAVDLTGTYQMEAIAKMIIAAHDVYIHCYINQDDDYQVKGEIGDRFLRAMEDMVMRTGR